MNFRYKTIVFSLLMSGMTLVSCDDFLTQGKHTSADNTEFL